MSSVRQDHQTDDDKKSACSSQCSSSHHSVARYSETSARTSSLFTQNVSAIYRLLSHDGQISTRDHMKAVEHLCRILSLFERYEDADKPSQIKLICVITALLRRITKLRAQRDATVVETDTEVVTDDTVNYYVHTMTMVFICVAAVDVIARGGMHVLQKAAEADLSSVLSRTLWSELSCSNNKRRIAPGDDLEDLERQRILTEEIIERRFILCEDSSDWSSVLYEPGATAGAALRVAGGLLSSVSSQCLVRLQELAFVFARNTIAQMQTQMLRSSDDRDFLTLSTRAFLSCASCDEDEDIMSIVLAGESEAGQSCLRDMMLSFLLPKHIIGVRRTLLLSREISARVAVEFPWIASIAHETAMMGCENVWKHCNSELKRACVLLSGFAMLSTPGSGDDMIRKAMAFNGFVQLPFLECPLHSSQTLANRQPKLLALVPSTRSWVIYTIHPSGQPSVDLSKRGLDGLSYALLGLSKDSTVCARVGLL